MANPRPPADQTRQRNGGTQVLVWMRDEFEALRRQVHALATSVAQQRSLLADLTDGNGADGRPDVNASLAELESCAAALRHEASKLQGLEKAMAERLTGIVADAVRPQLRAAVAARLPGLVTETVQPELRAALAEVRECAEDLKDEYSRLRSMRDDLASTLPALVQASVEKALGTAGVTRSALVGSTPTLPAPVPAPATAPPPVPRAPATAAAAPPAAPASPAPPAAPAPTPTVPGRINPPASPAPQPAPAPPVGEGGRASSPSAAPAGTGMSTAVRTLVEPAAAAPPLVSPPATIVDLPPVSPGAATNGSHPPSEVPGDEVTCVMPGMVVGPTLAEGVTTALGRARLRRRRRRRAAAPAPGLYRRDPFAGHVTRRLERFTRGRASAAATRTPATEGRMGEGAWANVALGALDGQEVMLDLSRCNGVVVDGPSAADAVRAIVTNLLASRSHDDGAAIVLGDLLPAVPPFPGLAQAQDLATVLEELKSEVTRRSKLLAEEGVPDAGAFRSRHPGAAMPLLLLALPHLEGADVAALQALVVDGARVGVNVVVAGSALAGATVVHLDHGGLLTTSPAAALDGARAFSLDTQTAAELLAVLASARTDGEHMRPVIDDNQAFRLSDPLPDAKVKVDLVGTYRIEVEGEEIRSGLRAKARELLAFYLLHPEGATLDEATEALWPEADTRRGSEWFWTALGNLRTRVRQVTGQKELKVIDRDGDLYRVEDIFDVDLWRLERALYEGVHGTDEEARGLAFNQATQAYSGELLTGVDWFWLETPREDLRERVVDVLVWLGDRRWAATDVQGAALALKQALDVDPFAEQVYRRVMRLQARIARLDEVDGTYRVLVQRLSEVGLEPTAETQKLRAELLPSA